MGALLSNALSHGYVLKGKATGALYNLALQLAQVLNCTNRPDWRGKTPENLAEMACGQCKDCRWIAQNSHPAVLTVSRLTFQVNEKSELMSPDELEKQAKKGSFPTQIKTDQVGRLIYQLGMSSEAYRVVIFTDVEILPASMPSDVTPPFDWAGLEANEGKRFHVRPLDRSIFNAFSVNKFLKTLEEPPPRMLFLFLTETEEQLLETIVSRCQVIPCLTEDGGALEAEVPQEQAAFLAEMLTRAKGQSDVYAQVAAFNAFFIEQQGFTATQAIRALQTAFRQRLTQSPLEEAPFSAYREIQQTLEQASRMIEAKTNEGQCLLNLFIMLTPHLKQFS